MILPLRIQLQPNKKPRPTAEESKFVRNPLTLLSLQNVYASEN